MTFKPNIIKLLFIVLITTLGVITSSVSAQVRTPLMERVYAMHDKVSDPDRQVGNFNPDSMPSLPIGLVKTVAGTKYIIAIDSAYFLADGAYFSAYMAVEFPGAEERLAFAAKDIKFNPKGIIGGEQSKLQLVSQHIIELGPHTKLMLPDDGSNYVSWSCNGFESVNLHGYFLFEEGMLSPPENSADSVVTAEFQVNVTDVHNMMTAVNFSPFTIRGLEDYNFTVSEAYVDMSDFQNPYNVLLPDCYQQTYSDDINLWRGFYLKFFSVELPNEMEKNNQPVTIYGNNMFIDDAGVTGIFGATNLFSTNEGKLAGDWGFSVNLLEIGLTTNKLTKGQLKGNIIVPPLDNTSMAYNALIEQNITNGLINYNFSINPSSSVSMSCFNSTLTLNQSSSINVSRVNRKFKPQLILNGTWLLDNPNLKLNGLAFQNFTLITQSPFVTSGVFSLVSSGPQQEAANFPISISQVAFGLDATGPVLGANVSLNFGDTSASNNFSASTTVKIHTKFVPNPETFKTEWKYDKFSLSTINLEVNTEPFELTGFINFNDNDPVYGKGFYGGLSLKVKKVLENPMSMACAFGRVNGYRYWMVDATIPVTVPLGTTTTITTITGGVAYHMQNTKSQQQLINDVSTKPPSGNALSVDYLPNANSGLFFKAGVGFKNTLKEETLNGDVLFTIAFNQYGGLENISLLGDAYMLCKVNERKTSTNYAHGSVAINYDNQEKIFDAQLAMTASFSGVLNANIWSHLHFEPGLWYVYLGTPSNQCTVDLIGLASANAYFMLGQNLPAMPPPPPQVASVLSGMSNQRNTADIASGNGISCGMNLSAGFNDSLWITNKIYAYAIGSAGAGFDMTLYKYAPTAHCEGSTGSFGMNHWYLQGQLYAYLGLNVGVSNGNWDWTFLEGNAAMLLQGKLPKPSYIYGGIYIQGNVLSIFDVSLTLQFDLGTDCTIVN